MEIRWRPCFSANASSSGSRAMPVLSSLTTSHSTPAGDMPGRPGQVDGGLGVAGPLEHAAGPVAEREDVAGPVEVGGPGVGVDQGLDGGGPVVGRDARRGPVPVVDADGEGGPLDLGVGGDHEREVEVLDPLGRERHADQPGGVGQEEGDLLGGDGVGRHDQVALVLAVLVVDHDDDLAPADRRDGLLDC